MTAAPIDLTPIIIAFITIVGGGSIAGLFAYRKSQKEAENQQAQTTASIIATADDVVQLVRREMGRELAGRDIRIDALEATVTAWDGWADRVLDILDRAIGLLTEEQKAALLVDVENARDSRPPRYHQFRAKHIIPKDEGT